MHPLTYTAPVSKAEYLGGRFLAAFVLKALDHARGAGGNVGRRATRRRGSRAPRSVPARGLLAAYGYIALPNAFVASAIQFALAALSRRAIVGYFGSVVLFFVTSIRRNDRRG